MKQIIALALTAKGFAPESVDAIYDVAAATGNTEVAINMLLGFYEPPEINPYATVEEKDIICTFQKYDPFKKEITYTYEKVERIRQNEQWIDDPNGTMVTRTSICHLDRWTKNKIDQ